MNLIIMIGNKDLQLVVTIRYKKKYVKTRIKKMLKYQLTHLGTYLKQNSLVLKCLLTKFFILT